MPQYEVNAGQLKELAQLIADQAQGIADLPDYTVADDADPTDVAAWETVRLRVKEIAYYVQMLQDFTADRPMPPPDAWIGSRPGTPWQ